MKLLKFTLFLLFFLFQANSTYANETESNPEKICDKQSILITAKLKSSKENEFSAQDLNMIRLGAIKGCMETLHRMNNSANFAESVSSDNEKMTKIVESKEKESIFDKLLRIEPKKDVNPMQKKHRTGGK